MWAGEAASAAAARDALSSVGSGGTDQPDLVLIDVNLGDDSGITLSRELTTRNPHLRIVLGSTMAEIDLPSDALDAGALAFLEKSQLDPGRLRDLAMPSPTAGV
mgnify:CR=1 FL=1